MKRYRLFKRGNVFYREDAHTGKQTSLKTTDRIEAEKLIFHQEEAERQSHLNLKLAQVYMAGKDPKLTQRTWQDVMKEIEKRGGEATRKRASWATRCKSFDSIRHMPLVETTPEDFLKVLESGKNSTNHYLRRYHNEALGLGWLPWPVLPKKKWPPIRYAKKRAVTFSEHQQIIKRERNHERRLFYEFLWETGASQSDAARLTHESINREQNVIIIHRKKIEHLERPPAIVTIGPRLESILKQLPAQGDLFPYLKNVDCKHRGTEFRQRCRGLGIHGISLHSYRYAWAQRAKQVGMAERHAQAALGHSSKAVHRAYSRDGIVRIPALDVLEQEMESKIIPFAKNPIPKDHETEQKTATQ